MRGQQKINHIPLLSIFIMVIFGTLYVAASPPGLTKLVNVESSVVGTAIDDTKLLSLPSPPSPPSPASSLPDRRLKKRRNGNFKLWSGSLNGVLSFFFSQEWEFIWFREWYRRNDITGIIKRLLKAAQSLDHSKIPTDAKGPICASNIPFT